MVPRGEPGVSKYLVDKFLFTIDRDPELVERYRTEPGRRSRGGRPRRPTASSTASATSAAPGCNFDDIERKALAGHDYVKLFELGAHPFLTLTLFIAMFERDHAPLGFQKEYALRLAHFEMPYPDIAT